MSAPDLPENHDPRSKRLGAYYTDSQVADFLTQWAIRRAEDVVAAPSFGGGVFLVSPRVLIERSDGASRATG